MPTCIDIDGSAASWRQHGLPLAYYSNRHKGTFLNGADTFAQRFYADAYVDTAAVGRIGDAFTGALPMGSGAVVA